MRRTRWRVLTTLAVAAACAGGVGIPAAAAPAGGMIATENFDSLESTLGSRVDETGIPPEVKGFTHTPPAGWSVQLAPGMPQGVTEWQGWSFTTMPFWKGAEAGQDRENFTRADKVFAVADPDEWDDKGSPSAKGNFDSTLVSKPFDIPAGLTKAYLGFASHYRQDGPQKATVSVSFDGGQDKVVRSYGPDAGSDNQGKDLENDFVSLGVDVPAGAKNMTVKWRLFDAGNNWYWAIDDVRVASQAIPVDPPPLNVPQGPNGVSKDKVLLIGLDGARWDKILSSDTPNLKRLINTGLFGTNALYAQPMAATSSGPGWSTMTHGVWPDKHNVRDNSFADPKFAKYPDFLTLAKRANPNLSTGFFSDWAPIGLGDKPVIGSGADVRVALQDANYTVQDQQIANAAAKYLTEQNPDAAFVYFADIDEWGHDKGGASPEYKKAVETADRQIGQLLDAIQARKTAKDENWLVMVSADHGHTDKGGHGGSSPEERGDFVIANGKGVPAGAKPTTTRLVDVAPTALRHLGVTIDPAWGLDGRPVTDADPDPFETLTPKLKERQDEKGIPAGIKGYTQETPAGWSIDNAKQPMDVGTTEWRGWSFTTDDFWTRAGRDQSRELNVRERGAFAVADPQRWNATGNPSGSGKKFDSTLVSQGYNVSGKASATVDFASHYRAGTTQQGTVLVSFDGKADQQVYTYTKDELAARRSLVVPVPSGARSMKVKFRLTGTGGDWYWAVDDLRVTTKAPSTHVGALTGTASKGPGTKWTGTATTQIVDQDGKPVKGAVVYGDWITGSLVTLPGFCVTNTEGTCSVTSTPVNNQRTTVIFVAKAVFVWGKPYQPGDNAVTTVNINRP
ncbi:alkaline phosphatase family protein [Actinocrispum wychmicini]|uniref:Type I phosphodiesterase/nucleotide pyrophosphatase n=1 Tax=Actinocrispum wychmicini TaxID=1213861 RepID=A0A4V6NNY0_9PSEU|nr:alkaline phosphatase family protein [Actinocrispum wychmicini]TCO59520.1 type I phosphodiesterase/nucleotide pyrophosphatase [Actinocrispum wychmicini]